MIRDNELHKFSNFFQAEQYAVGVFVHTVRNYLGPKWQPLRISITSTPVQPENCAMAKCCGELETGAEHCVVTVPIDRLDEERKGLPNSIKTQGLPPSAIQPDSHHVLKQLLFSYLPDYPLTRKSVSQILMLHPKTLYRQLEKDGISYSAIRNEVILERAKAELASGELSIGEIARLLGYSHQSAFTRAFEKLVGMPPQDFRKSTRTAQ